MGYGLSEMKMSDMMSPAVSQLSSPLIPCDGTTISQATGTNAQQLHPAAILHHLHHTNIAFVTRNVLSPLSRWLSRSAHSLSTPVKPLPALQNPWPPRLHSWLSTALPRPCAHSGMPSAVASGRPKPKLSSRCSLCQASYQHCYKYNTFRTFQTDQW